MHTTLVICTKNEAASLDRVIRTARPFVDRILIIDGHSTDRTIHLLKKHNLKVITDDGTGKGNAIRLGIRNTSTPIIVFMDADGSHEARDIPNLILPIAQNKADIVVASRRLGGSDEWTGSMENHMRAIGNHIITTLVNLRFGTRLTDTQNGFRAIRRSTAVALNLTEQSTTIEQEMIIKALKRGYRLAEVASHEYAREFGHSHIRLLKHGWQYVWNVASTIF